MVTNLNKWFLRCFGIYWFSFCAFVKCLSGKHDWVQEVDSVTLRNRGRQCSECPARQEYIDDSWQYIKRKVPHKRYV